MKYRIHFVISNLGNGGAEMMLYKLLSRINRRVFVPEVTSLTDFVPMADKFRNIDVPVRIFRMSRRIPDPRWIFRLAEVFRSNQPHLVQTWMYHADLVGGFAAKIAGGIPVIWNIRHSNLGSHTSKKMTRLTAKACAMFSSHLPARIVCCAEASRQIHIDIGYDPSRMLVIPNGFDLASFKPDSQARQEVCRELGIPHDAIVVGLVARFHPEKDHQTFIRAAAILNSKVSNAHFVLCGDGITWENRQLSEWIEAAGMCKAFHLLGYRTDIPRLSASFDISTSSSISEGFSNTIGESMACCVPCAVTDVGDSAAIVGETGRVVATGDPAALAEAWRALTDLGMGGRMELGRRARARILELFAIDTVIQRYENLYQEVLSPSLTSDKLFLR